MNLAEKKQLIDYMIRKNPDATIRDYLQMVKEFDDIRKTADDVPVAWLIKFRTEELNRPVLKHPVAITTINSR